MEILLGTLFPPPPHPELRLSKKFVYGKISQEEPYMPFGGGGISSEINTKIMLAQVYSACLYGKYVLDLRVQLLWSQL